MNKLNQLATLVLVLLAMACQANSSENPENVKKTEVSITPTTTTAPNPNFRFTANGLTNPNDALAPAEKKGNTVVDSAMDDESAPPSHQGWNNLLTQYVGRAGAVNYQGLKTRMKDIDAYLKLLAEHPVQDSWSKADKMSYWFNAYNAFTVKLILDNYPLKSILDLENGKVWDKKWIKLGDKTYSLNNIENDILRPNFKDPRIHFAVNCAAKSCPPLLNRAWTSENLEFYLERQATAFINNPKYNQISADKVVVSKIFEWYAKDFGNLIEYLNKYSKTKIKPNAKISYQEYNWNLNKVE